MKTTLLTTIQNKNMLSLESWCLPEVLTGTMPTCCRINKIVKSDECILLKNRNTTLINRKDQYLHEVS